MMAYDTKHKKITMINVPRDLMTDVPIYTADGVYSTTKKQQICLAYAYGDGKDKSCDNVKTVVERLFYNMPVKTYFPFAALENSMALAREYGDGTLIRYTEAYAAAADLRVFVRCIAAGKEKSFMNRAVAETPLFDKTAALDAAGEGLPALLDFLAPTPLAPLAHALREKDPAFEAKCDAFAAKTLDAGLSDAFGVAPVLRYYLRAGEEIRNLRILLTGKLNNLPEETIRERMRWGYV